MWVCGKKYQMLTKLLVTAQETQGGIYKRIDENRELLQLLMEKHPEVLEKSPWIEGWIRSNDDYFMNLLDDMGLPFHKDDPNYFVRPFPVGKDHKVCLGTTGNGMSALLNNMRQSTSEICIRDNRG